MFKDKTIQIDLVKKNQENNITPEQSEKAFRDNADIVNDVIGKNIARAGVVMLGYVVLDTVRKVVVNATTPQ